MVEGDVQMRRQPLEGLLCPPPRTSCATATSTSICRGVSSPHESKTALSWIVMSPIYVTRAMSRE
jgi:hypothetical protein